MRTTTSVVALLVSGLLVGCVGGGPSPDERGTGSGPDDDPSASSPGPDPSPSPTPPTPTPTPTTAPTTAPRFDAGAAHTTVRRLADGIGPRMATGPAYARAADLVSGRFRELGYAVERRPLRVPAGTTWGVAVPAGTADNVVARPDGLGTDDPHVVVGAHLDSVPRAPGAEDNASGVATMLELARMTAAAPAPVPVVFVAFAAEEPRGQGDAHHHYGSRRYVAGLSAAQRRAVRGMVSLDRVGVGADVRVRTGGRGPSDVAEAIRAAGRRIGVPTSGGQDTASDHWSFEKAGIAAAKLGGHAYAGYHDPSDTSRFVRRDQLARTGRLVWTWLNAS